jgi:hypothetical protein
MWDDPLDSFDIALKTLAENSLDIYKKHKNKQYYI